MSKNIPEQQPNEEIDLGQIFTMIGNLFDRFFKFIASIFIGIYKLVLLFLIHFYKRFIWYVVMVVIGLIAGIIIDMNNEKMYGANIFIETNFNSARQVYENIKQFQQLAYTDKDTLELAKRFNISPEEASKLKGFYIEPDIDENKIVEMYSEFYKSLDSISRADMSYSLYKESLTAYNFKIHKIGVASTDKYLYKKIESAFVDGLSNNKYLEDLLQVNTENLKLEDKTLQIQIQKIDSLVDEYLKIRINESNKELIPGSGTNLYMGDAETNGLIVDESKIIERRLKLAEDRRLVNQSLVENQNVINVVAGFPTSGYYIGEWYTNMKLTLPICAFGLTFLVFSFMGLGKYLEKESKKG